MKQIYNLLAVAACVTLMLFGSSCAPKYGCPGNGKNVGAERILSGDKVPKAKKFKS
jgi:hypothetical protein